MVDASPTPGPDTRRVNGALDGADAAAVRALAAAAAATDGVPPLSEQPLLWLTGGGPDVVHLLAGTGSDLVGYAQADLRDPALATAEVVVHPAHRRHGTGSALLAALRDAATARGADHVDVWAHGDLPA
ncbi:GNAT family N-acetyltransferase, partial [Cellulomonas triticagri]